MSDDSGRRAEKDSAESKDAVETSTTTVVTEQTGHDLEVEKNRQVRKRLKIAVIAMAMIFVILLGTLIWQSYLGPQRSAEQALKSAIESRGAIEAVNRSLEDFEGAESPGDTNVEQRALAGPDGVTSPPGFVFSNGKQSDDRSILSFYVDFADQRSKDALISNSNVLKNMVESGLVELHIHPVFGGREYSIYAAEALAEVFAADSEFAWNSLLALLRNAPAISEISDQDEMAESIASILQQEGVTSVDRASIQNGTFSSWLLSIGSDPTIGSASNPTLPYILVDGKQSAAERDQLNNPDIFRRIIAGEVAR